MYTPYYHTQRCSTNGTESSSKLHVQWAGEYQMCLYFKKQNMSVVIKVITGQILMHINNRFVCFNVVCI
jgi:hypothetical protein